MATVAEKDVLLEMVADTLALTSRKIKGDRRLGFPEEEKTLLNIREYLYDTNYKEIDYQAVLSKCQTIRREYQKLPDAAITWSGYAS